MDIFTEKTPQTIAQCNNDNEINTLEVRMWFSDVEKVEVKNINDHDKKLKLEICENIQKELKQNVRNVQVLLDPLEKEDYAVLTGVIRGYRNSLYIVEKLKKQILEK